MAERTVSGRQRSHSDGTLTVEERRGGTDNALYGNHVTGFAEGAFSFPNSEDGQSPGAQRIYCGNVTDGPSDGAPGAECSDDVPDGAGIGHTGGDSPFSG